MEYLLTNALFNSSNSNSNSLSNNSEVNNGGIDICGKVTGDSTIDLTTSSSGNNHRILGGGGDQQRNIQRTPKHIAKLREKKVSIAAPDHRRAAVVSDKKAAGMKENEDNCSLSSAAMRGRQENEFDYDKNPTKLYSLIQSKKWDETLTQTQTNPPEASHWVYRTERDHQTIRWRLLPLHAAIIFRAPEKVIEALLLAHPHGAQAKDDQGMLPLHLAFRNRCSDVIVTLLLMAYPRSVEVGDRKRRLPLTLAQLAPEGALRDSYVNALQKSPGYYKITEAAIAANAVRPPRPILRNRQECPPGGDAASSSAQSSADEAQQRTRLTDQITSLEKELSKTKEHGIVVVNHVDQLEAQLKTRSDTERFLASKIATLDAKLKEVTESKEIREAELTAQNHKLETHNKQLEEELVTLREKVKEQEVIVTDKTEVKQQWEAKIRSLEAERAQITAQSAVLEAQLKMKVKNEQTLATQVSDLAAKLADGAGLNADSTKSYTERIDRLEVEKTTLERSLSVTGGKVREMMEALDVMAADQLKIVDMATKHEEVVVETVKAQEQIMMDVERQEASMAEAAKEREQIVEILTRQAMEIDRTREDRLKLASACQDQDNTVKKVSQDKNKLIETIAATRNGMDQLRNKATEIYNHSSCIVRLDAPSDDPTAAQQNSPHKPHKDASKSTADVKETQKPMQTTDTHAVKPEPSDIPNKVEDTFPTDAKRNSTAAAISPISDTNNYNNNQEPRACTTEKELAINKAVHDELQHNKPTRPAAQREPSHKNLQATTAETTTTPVEGSTSVGNTIPTSISLGLQEEASSTADSNNTRLNRELFHAKEKKVREAIELHKVGENSRACCEGMQATNLYMNTNNSKANNSNVQPSRAISHTASMIPNTASMNQAIPNTASMNQAIPNTASMAQRYKSFTNPTTAPSEASSEVPSSYQLKKDFGSHQMSYVPSAIHMNQSSSSSNNNQANTSNQLSMPSSMHRKHQTEPILIPVQSLSGMHSVHANQYKQNLPSKSSSSFPTPVSMNKFLPVNNLESNSGNQAKREDMDDSIEELLLQAERLVQLTDSNGNLEVNNKVDSIQSNRNGQHDIFKTSSV